MNFTLKFLNKKNRWVSFIGYFFLVGLTSTQLSCREDGGRDEIIIPDDQPTIDAGIMSANDGDVILIRPGVYYENLNLHDKKLTLASMYYVTGQDKYIEQTIIDGDGNTVIDVNDRAIGSKIMGLTIQNGEDGITTSANMEITNNRFIQNSDGVDYEGGGGTCSFNVFMSNTDDGIDLDGAVAVNIYNNKIINNGDDGIEIRLHPYKGPMLDIIVSGNEISGNGEDGIQIIDYPKMSDRTIKIERNIIVNNEMAAIGFMGDGNTKEDFSGAPIPEQVLIFNNTLIDNDYGIVGGANVVALNNIISGTTFSAVRNVVDDSIVSYSVFWNNGVNYENSNINLDNIIFLDPFIEADYFLPTGSPAIDAGTAIFDWKGERVLDISQELFLGVAPDIGAFESE